MSPRFSKIVLTSLLSFTMLAISAPHGVEAVEPVQPFIQYSDSSGLKFVAVKQSIATIKNPTFQWLIGGKPVSGGNKAAFKATEKQKGVTIQLRVTSDGQNYFSVVGRIGQVLINLKPSIAFLDSNQERVIVTPGVISPSSAKVTYQWYKGPIDIPSAKGSSYTAATSDQGFKIYVNARYFAKGFKENFVDSHELEIPVRKRTYLQVWQDEFNLQPGSSLDSTIWSPENGDGSNTAAGGGWGNKERQFYTSELAKILPDGSLEITATRSGASAYSCYYKTSCEWISSKYITKGKIGFKYGRIEARIKGPVGSGTWAAFWMLGADIDQRRWPWCGEIDITELIGREPNTNYGYLHGLLSGGFGGRGATVAMPDGFADDYHTYAIDWLPDQIDWYVDGKLFGSQSKIDKDWVFDHEFYLILNLAMGGNLGGPIDPKLSEAKMNIDWVRYSTINGVGEIFKH